MNTVDSHKISVSQLFCLLMLSRLSAEIVYLRSGAGCGGETLLAVLAAEFVRLLLGLPIIIYSFKKTQIYRALWEKNRAFGVMGAFGAAVLLVCASAKTIWALGTFARQNLLTGVSALLLCGFAAAFAIYAAFSGAEGMARAGALFLVAAVIITVVVMAANIPNMKAGALIRSNKSGFGVFLEDVTERVMRGGEYLVFAALLPYVRIKKMSAPATIGLFAVISALAALSLSGFYCLVLREIYGLVEYPFAAASSIANIGLFRRLDGGACAGWALCAALRAGVMLFCAWSVCGQVLFREKNNSLQAGLREAAHNEYHHEQAQPEEENGL